MPIAREIFSNLKRATTTVDEDLAVAPATLAHYNSLPKDGESTPEMVESAQEAFELNYANSARFRWKGQERWQGRENEEMRLVRIMHPHEVFRRLRKGGVDARTEAPTFYVWGIDDDTGKPMAIKKQRSLGRIWLHDEAVKGRVGITGRVWNETAQRYEIKYITHLQYPYSPEWSLMRFNDWNVPTVERYRGWRTALLQLILRGVITEREVKAGFGPVPLNDASLLYRKTLYDYRNRRGIA